MPEAREKYRTYDAEIDNAVTLAVRSQAGSWKRC